MLKDLNKIKQIREKRVELKEEEERLAAPLLTDLAHLDTIYDWFCHQMENKVIPTRIDSSHGRKLFMFLALYYYSPAAIVGDRIRNNVREKLATLLKCNPTYISHSIEKIEFLWQHYKYFSEELDNLCTRLDEDIRNNLLDVNRTLPGSVPHRADPNRHSDLPLN